MWLVRAAACLICSARPTDAQEACRRIIWISASEPVKGFFVGFPAITMHAVAQEPEPCIYAQLEARGSEHEDDEEDDEENYPEIRLVPQNHDKR